MLKTLKMLMRTDERIIQAPIKFDVIAKNLWWVVKQPQEDRDRIRRAVSFETDNLRRNSIDVGASLDQLVVRLYPDSG